MTIEEFERIATYNELDAADSELGTGVFDEFYIKPACALDDYICDEISNWDWGWRELGNFLYNFPDGYDWYDLEEDCGLEDGDDLFFTAKDEIRRRAEYDGAFDESDTDNVSANMSQCESSPNIHITIEDFSLVDIF